jgi:hypothetical protein
MGRKWAKNELIWSIPGQIGDMGKKEKKKKKKTAFERE